MIEIPKSRGSTTVKDVYDTLNHDQKVAVDYLVDIASRRIKVAVPQHVRDGYNSLSELQRHVVQFMIGTAHQNGKKVTI